MKKFKTPYQSFKEDCPTYVKIGRNVKRQERKVLNALVKEQIKKQEKLVNHKNSKVME